MSGVPDRLGAALGDRYCLRGARGHRAGPGAPHARESRYLPGNLIRIEA